MSSMPHRGRWQAQGADIKKPPGGHSVRWDLSKPPSKSEGTAHVDALKGQCTPSQRQLRGDAWAKAQRWISRAPSGGYSTVGGSKSFYVEPSDRKYRGARVDLELKAGQAFTS